MVMTAQGSEVALAGRAIRVRVPMVEVAVLGGLPAAGEATDLVAGDDVPSQRRWRPVDRGAVVEQDTRDRIGEDASPGGVGVSGDLASHLGRDRPIASQLARQVVETQQSGGGDRDLDVRPTAAMSAQAAAPTRATAFSMFGWRERRPAQVDQGVGASGLDVSWIRRVGAAGEGFDRVEHEGGVVGWKNGGDLGHAIGSGYKARERSAFPLAWRLITPSEST